MAVSNLHCGAADAKRGLLREALRSGRLVRMVGAHDALTAKLIEDAGFEGVWASGLEISASHLVPDASVLTMSEFLGRADWINQAVAIPVVADCDTGFGDETNVARTVVEYERIGVAGICVEDNTFPKANSYVSKERRLLSIEEFVAKIKAAVSARFDSQFCLFARTEAFVAGEGLEGALARASAYAEAGADAIVVQSAATTLDEVASFARRWTFSAPLVAIPTRYSSARLPDVSSLGVNAVIFANVTIRAEIESLRRVLARLSSAESLADVESSLCGLDDLFRLQGSYYHRIGSSVTLSVESKQAAPRADGDASGELPLQSIHAGTPNSAALTVRGRAVD